ncbi:MAG: PAS domain S-box protein [Pseudomonadota bacterium]
MDLSDPQLAARILDTAPVIALVLDPQGRIEFINSFGERLTGYSMSELRGQDWFEKLLTARDRDRVRGRFAGLLAGQPMPGAINQVLTRDGALRDIDWASRPLKDTTGHTVGLLAIGNDVTERRAAEAALRQGELRYRELFDANPHPMWVYDLDTLRFLAVNDAAVDHYGWTREDFLALTIADIRPTEDRSRLAINLNGAQPGFERAGVWRHLCRDGRLIFVEISSNDLPFGGRRARLVLANDVTARIEAERESQALTQQRNNALDQAVAAEAQLREVLARVDDAFVAVDRDGRYTFVNARAEQLLGCPSPDDLLGRHAWTEFANAVGEPLQQALEQAMRNQQPTVLEMHSPDRSRWFEARAYPSANGLSIYFTDITLRKRAEETLQGQRAELEHQVQARTTELVAARDEAERANHAKSQFLSRMSHELRTPLNAILGFGQLMGMDRGVSDKHRGYVHEMLHAGRHLLALINEVLDLARIESGQLALSPEPVALADLVSDSLRMSQPLAEARGVHLEAHGLESIVLRADRTRLRQVLLNLLSNAIKYNRPQGRVLVDARLRPDGRVRLSVTDTGQGIEDARLPELFQPFQRLGAEFSEVEGTGIGLSIAKQLITLMGGSIGVEGRPGLGARFWVDLPADRLADPPAARMLTSDEPQPSQPPPPWRTVLHVEDNPANLRLVEQIMARHARVRMLSASAGRPALALARRQQPDLILLDIHLPDINGHALLAQLRADQATRHIPVVALTAQAMPDDERRARAAGFDNFLAKPLDVARLDALIDALNTGPHAG